MSKKKVEARVRNILTQSNDWHSWQRALESALYLDQIAQEEYRLLYCVDASEVVEYLNPGSLRHDNLADDPKAEEYPTPLDLALLILFRSEREVFILPPHYLELRSLGDLWAAQARLAIQKLLLVQDALRTYEARLDTLSRDKEKGIDQFVQFVLREGRSFGVIFWLSSEGHSWNQLVERLQPPDRKLLGIDETWDYRPETQEIEDWFQKLEGTGLGRGDAASYRRDAHALVFLDKVNRAMPERSFLILSTHSGKIWKAIEELRNTEEGANTLFKREPREGAEGRGISLVLWPQVELVRELLAEAQEGEERNALRENLVLERERNQGLGNLRARLMHEILPYLERKQTEALDLVEVEKLVTDLEEGLKKMESISRDRQRLDRTRLALDSSVGERGPLARLRQVIEGRREEELKDLLKKEMGDILEELEEVQQKLTIAASATPETSLSFEGFEEGEPSFGIRGILYSRPTGVAYTIHFQSAAVEKHLERIQELLRNLDNARSLPSGGGQRQAEEKKVGLELQREMYKCEVQLKNEPEYYLLLSSVYSSRKMGFQAYDAADRGLKMLRERGHSEDAPHQGLEVASAWTELLLAQAMAFTSWTLENHTDLSDVAATFLARSAGFVRRSLCLQQRWSGVLRYYKGRDPRLLRELGIIYGSAYVVGIALEIHPEDCALAGIPPGSPPTLLDLFFAFSRDAYRELTGQGVGERSVYYENSLLYALIERDREEELEEREALTALLSQRPEAKEEAKLLDTLAWHHFRLAQRCKRSGQPYDAELSAAQEYLEAAARKLDPKNRYSLHVHREHRQTIEAFAGSPGEPG